MNKSEGVSMPTREATDIVDFHFGGQAAPPSPEEVRRDDREFLLSLLPQLDAAERRALYLNSIHHKGLTVAGQIRQISNSIISRVEAKPSPLPNAPQEERTNPHPEDVKLHYQTLKLMNDALEATRDSKQSSAYRVAEFVVSMKSDSAEEQPYDECPYCGGKWIRKASITNCPMCETMIGRITPIAAPKVVDSIYCKASPDGKCIATHDDTIDCCAPDCQVVDSKEELNPMLNWTCEWCGNVAHSSADYFAHKDFCSIRMSAEFKVEEQDGEQELPPLDVNESDRHEAFLELEHIATSGNNLRGFVNMLKCRERQFRAALREPSKGLDSLSIRPKFLETWQWGADKTPDGQFFSFAPESMREALAYIESLESRKIDSLSQDLVGKWMRIASQKAVELDKANETIRGVGEALSSGHVDDAAALVDGYIHIAAGNKALCSCTASGQCSAASSAFQCRSDINAPYFVDSLSPKEPTDEDEVELELSQAVRLELFLSHPCEGKYGDDGEMQCNARMPIDFKRDFPSEILAKSSLHRLMRAAAFNEAKVGSHSEGTGVDAIQLLREIRGEHDRLSVHPYCACWMCVRINDLSPPVAPPEKEVKK